MQAPTAGNQMLYTILQISDQNLKERLAKRAITSHLSPKRRWCWCFWRIFSAGTTHLYLRDVIPVCRRKAT